MFLSVIPRMFNHALAYTMPDDYSTGLASRTFCDDVVVILDVSLMSPSRTSISLYLHATNVRLIINIEYISVYYLCAVQ